jgi:hypothetical protein
MCDVQDKRCSKCGERKPRDAFNKSAARKDGLQPRCKACLFAYREANRSRELARAQAWAAENADRVREHKRAWVARNPDKVTAAREKDRPQARARNRTWYARHRDQILAKKREFTAQNPERKQAWNQAYAVRFPERINALTALRRARRHQATPGWGCPTATAVLYAQAKVLSAVFGVDLEVDHVVPIHSKIVCGLHCTDNLQLLASDDNTAKGNRHWPDMPGSDGLY